MDYGNYIIMQEVCFVWKSALHPYYLCGGAYCATHYCIVRLAEHDRDTMPDNNRFTSIFIIGTKQ